MGRFVFVLVGTLCVLFSGCAIYHPQRSIFVSSQPQQIDVDSQISKISISDIKIIINSANSSQSSQTQSSMYSVEGAYVPFSHTYVFDAVDFENLIKSLHDGLENNGVKVYSQEVTEEPVVTAVVTFQRLDMTSHFIGTGCLISASIDFTKGANKHTEIITVEEVSGMTVSSSKNQAIVSFVKSFISKLSEFVANSSAQVI